MIATLLEERPVAKDRLTVAPVPQEEEVFIFPATAAQRRFWLLDQLVPGGNPALNVPLAARLRGRLDLPVLERAFNEVMRRHEILRTTFHYEKGQLLQAIAPEMTMRVPTVDVMDFPAAERANVQTHFIADEARRPFDLVNGPLLRARVVRVSPSEHLLLFPIHHIIADGWSNGVLLREIGALYAAFAEARPSPLPELPIQFADFAQWQQDGLAGGAFDAQLDYWRGQLSGELPVVDLPVDRPRAPWRNQAAPGEVRSRRLPPALTQALRSLAAREGASPFMMFLAGFAVLLSRYSGGQEDLLVGTSSANRDRLEIENLIGLFVNPLLLRFDLSGEPTFREFLTRVRAVVLGAFEHADAPFEKIIEELQPRRLQINFLYQNAFLQPAKLPDLEIEPMRAVSGGVLYEWTVTAIEDAEGVRIDLEYNTEIFEAATVERVLASYERLLTAVAEGGVETPIARLPLLADADAASAAAELHAARWRLPEASVRWIEQGFDAAGPTGYRAQAGVRLWLLDRQGQPVPVGVPGLISVEGGAGVGTLTTGDLGRQRTDGRVEWLGPMEWRDSINGLRVERGHIEGLLRAHPHVREAAVLWRGGAGGERKLVAYFQSDGAPAALVSGGQMRAFLKESLPDEVMPAAFVRVDHFPMTADGRLDEAALPDAGELPEDGSQEKHGTPYLTIHHQIIEIWREVLGVATVGIRDDFFSLGGNSLLAMRMLYRVEQTFGKTLLPATLFRRATVEGVADEIIKHSGGEDSPEVIRIQEKGAKTPIFFLHGDISGGGFYCMKLARDLGDDQPFYALPPVDVIDPLVDRPTIEEMAAAHVRVIRLVRPHGPYILGGFCLGGLTAYEVAQQLTAAGEEVERLIVIDAWPKNRRLKMLRRAAEKLGRWRGFDANRQLYFFCRWHYWLARIDRWRNLDAGERRAILRRRLFGRFRRRKEETVAVGSSGSVAATTMDPDAPTAWFDPLLDVPLVFLWAAGGYVAKPYAGTMVVLLSSDLMAGAEGGNPARDWERFASRLQTVGLAGSHLECITKHVGELAVTVRGCLEG